MEVHKTQRGYTISGSHLITFRIKLDDLQAVEKVLKASPHVTIVDRGLATEEFLFACVVKATTQQQIIGLVSDINRACPKGKENRCQKKK